MGSIRRQRFLEMAYARKEILQLCSELQTPITLHLVKLALLDMGDRDYTPLMNSWRGEIAVKILKIQERLWSNNHAYLDAKDYFTYLFIKPLTYDSGYSDTPTPALSQIRRIVKLVFAEYAKKAKTSRKIPLHFKEPDSEDELYEAIQNFYLEIAEGLSKGQYESQEQVARLLQERGF